MDNNATLENTRHFFKQTFPRIRMMAHYAEEQLMQIDITKQPVIHMDTVKYQPEAYELLQAVLWSIAQIQNPKQRYAVQQHYLLHKSYKELSDELKRTPSMCYLYSRLGLLEFVDIFKQYYDLRVFKD